MTGISKRAPIDGYQPASTKTDELNFEIGIVGDILAMRLFPLKSASVPMEILPGVISILSLSSTA